MRTGYSGFHSPESSESSWNLRVCWNRHHCAMISYTLAHILNQRPPSIPSSVHDWRIQPSTLATPHVTLTEPHGKGQPSARAGAPGVDSAGLLRTCTASPEGSLLPGCTGCWEGLRACGGSLYCQHHLTTPSGHVGEREDAL